MKIRVGTTFDHQHLIDPNWRPGPGETYVDAPRARCEVSAVRKGAVYFRYVGTTGAFRWVDIKTFVEWTEGSES